MAAERVFDYVIVGAGSAGCVLASRLSEEREISVGILEAGGPDHKQEIHIPAAFSKLFKSDCDWAYYTEEQKHLNGRRLYWPRGKVLGGSSSMNAMIYTRGNRHDFDEWQRLGADGWSYSEVLPAFRRAERRQKGAAGGPLDVCSLRTTNPLSHAFLAACEETGIPRNDDFDGEVQEGAGLFRVTQRSGRRLSCARAYLEPAMTRRNLTVVPHAQATRLLFERGQARGVEYVHEGKTLRMRAEREVILSGGAVNSPQLLMLSGIGPADDLHRFGLPVVADLPGVGRNLQDHLAAGNVFHCTRPVTLGGAETIGNLLRFLILRKGMLTSNVAEAGAFVRMSADAPAPDVELLFGPTYYMEHGFANPKGHGFTLAAILLHPRSRGRISLRSADPLAAPAIQPEYLSDPADARLLSEGLARCREIAQRKPFDPFRGEEVWPGSATAAMQLEAYVRERTESLYHPVGTCRMGSDEMGVVDARLRVRGVEGLRVADASIMPTIVSGHPNAAVVMIAERAAEMIAGGS